MKCSEFTKKFWNFVNHSMKTVPHTVEDGNSIMAHVVDACFGFVTALKAEDSVHEISVRQELIY